MRAWQWFKAFSKGPVAGASNWWTFLGPFVPGAALMSWFASTIEPVYRHGWGAVAFAGIAAMCVVVMALSVGMFGLAALRWFQDLKPAIPSTALVSREAAQAPPEADTTLAVGEAVAQLRAALADRLDRIEATIAAISSRQERERTVLLHMLHQQTLASSITTASEVLAAMSEDAVGHRNDNYELRRAGYEGAVKLAVGKLRSMRGFDALGDVLKAAEMNAEHYFNQMDPTDFRDMHPSEMRRYRIAIDQWERAARYVREQREELVWELAGEASTLQRAARQLENPDAA